MVVLTHCKCRSAGRQVLPPPLSRHSQDRTYLQPRPPLIVPAPVLWPNFYFLANKRFFRKQGSEYRVSGRSNITERQLRVRKFRLPLPWRVSINRTRGSHIEAAFLNTSFALSRLLTTFLDFPAFPGLSADLTHYIPDQCCRQNSSVTKHTEFTS